MEKFITLIKMQYPIKINFYVFFLSIGLERNNRQASGPIPCPRDFAGSNAFGLPCA